MQPQFIQNSLPPLQQPKKAPECSVVFLERGGETVKGVLTVPEFQHAVVFSSPGARHRNRRSLFTANSLPLPRSTPPSSSARFLSFFLSSQSALMDYRHRSPAPSSPPHMGQICTNLTPNHMAHGLLLFLTSCTPTSSLSSAPHEHTVFPTYLPMCNTCTVKPSDQPTQPHTNTHPHTPRNTSEHTDHNLLHITVAPVWVFCCCFHCSGLV